MSVSENKKGLLLVVSGPSGTGKGTICQLVRQELPDMAYSVSVTTREPRVGEVDGKSYFFKTIPEVKRMIANGELLEYAEVFGNYYGTPRKYVIDLLEQGKDVLLEIDIQGALQVKKSFPEGVFVFIVPPSLKELERRLVNRGTDSMEVIKCRLAGAKHELSFAPQYKYIVVNDVLDVATRKVLDIMGAERVCVDRMLHVVDELVGND